MHAVQALARLLGRPPVRGTGMRGGGGGARAMPCPHRGLLAQRLHTFTSAMSCSSVSSTCWNRWSSVWYLQWRMPCRCARARRTRGRGSGGGRARGRQLEHSCSRRPCLSSMTESWASAWVALAPAAPLPAAPSWWWLLALPWGGGGAGGRRAPAAPCWVRAARAAAPSPCEASSAALLIISEVESRRVRSASPGAASAAPCCAGCSGRGRSASTRGGGDVAACEPSPGALVAQRTPPVMGRVPLLRWCCTRVAGVGWRRAAGALLAGRVVAWRPAADGAAARIMGKKERPGVRDRQSAPIIGTLAWATAFWRAGCCRDPDRG